MMIRAGWFLLLAVGCARPTPSPTVEGPSDERTATPEAPAAAPEACVVMAEARPAPAVHPDLLAVAPQYFHGSHRGGFDAYRGGGSVFPWFDAQHLTEPAVLSRHVRVTASSGDVLVAIDRDGRLGFAERGSRDVSWTGIEAYAEEAVAWGDEVWVLVRNQEHWEVVRRSDGHVFLTGIPTRTWDVRLAVNGEGTPVLAWLRREGATLQIRLAWNLDVASAEVADEVTLSEPVAALSARSRVDLAVAADGLRRIGLAWRPLSDPSFAAVGSQSSPPSIASPAEVRWLHIEPDGSRSDVARSPTLAEPLAGTSGIGPWGLTGNGMKAHPLGGRALFVWRDGGEIRGVRADSEVVVTLAPSEGQPLISLQPGGLLLFDSTPRVRAIGLRCGG